jgi:2-polyprenyl-6-methoxyphenol hydroxylase-like FAD-dependent oxidoreductase
MREEQTEVLVVGAGPVGLLAAVLLAEAGIKVRIIDQERRTTTRSYACALHRRALELLARLGLAAELLERGRRVEKVAFYDGLERRAEISLAQPGIPWPLLLILPQNVLEEALERRLRQKAGIAVDWNHRFDSCQLEGEAVVATVEELGGTSTGYIVPHWEMVVFKRLAIRARFLVGADGPNSQVRKRLGLEYRSVAGPVQFAACEFKSDAPLASEVRVVLDDATTNVLWPLAENQGRWTVQLVNSEIWPVTPGQAAVSEAAELAWWDTRQESHSQPEKAAVSQSAEFPEKERRAVHLQQEAVDERLRQYVQRLGRQRAPWFSGAVQEVTWCREVGFEQRLVKQFGRHRCWLAGDAAHQTWPVGAQSMNAGLCEAESLAGRLQKVLRGGAALASLQDYDRQWQAEWGRLLGLSGGLKPRSNTGEWVRRRLPRLLSCLPGSGEDLVCLANQLALDV